MEPFPEEKKKREVEFHLCGLKTLLEFILVVFTAWQKPTDFFLLACAFCTETRGQEACKHIHISNQALAESGRPQLLVVYDVSYPLSAPPLFMWDGRPWSSFY